MKRIKSGLALIIVAVLCLALLPMEVLANSGVAEIMPTEPTTPAEKPSVWAETDVTNAITANLVPQDLQGKYTQAATRAEFCALAVALYETVTGRTITERKTFDDTSDINVEKMAALGVVNGVGENQFAPDSGLTREQAATMLSRLADAVGKPLAKQGATFADNSSISSWAIEAVGQMQAAGIMGGVGENTFDPQGAYTREQSIVTVLRLYNAVKLDDSDIQKALSYKTYEGVTPAFPDFAEVTGIPMTSSLTSSATAVTYFYGQNTVTSGDVQKYLDVLRALGFTPLYSSDSFTLDENSTQIMSFIPPGVVKSQQEWLTTRVNVAPVSQNNFSIQLLGVTYTPESKYPMYDDYPFVPDFGAIFGVPLKSTDNSLGVRAYYYNMRDLDIAAGVEQEFYFSVFSGSATPLMEEKLVECGFTREIRNSAAGLPRTYYEGFGYSVRISSFTPDRGYGYYTEADMPIGTRGYCYVIYIQKI